MSGEFHRQDDELLGTSAQLIAHVDNLVTQGELTLNPLETEMLYLLAKRIDNKGRGVNPLSYITATEMLIYDCAEGKDSITDEPMPPNVTGLHRSMGSIFHMQARVMARGAFGDAFGDKVDEHYDKAYKRRDEQNPPAEE